MELEDEYKKKKTAELMGTPLEKWEPIELHVYFAVRVHVPPPPRTCTCTDFLYSTEKQAQELQKEKKAVREGSDLEHQLNETEQNLRLAFSV